MKMVCSIEAVFVLLLSVVLIAWGNVNNYEQFCTIDTRNGPLRGKLNRTLYDEVPYYSFRGIPFGKPPIGYLRFKVNYFLIEKSLFRSFVTENLAEYWKMLSIFQAPQKSEPWNGTLDALAFRSDCLQARLDKQQLFGSEDCLYLNVFVPKMCSDLNPTTKLPVMVYIYGGGFAFGTPRFYLPDFFLETNVLFV